MLIHAVRMTPKAFPYAGHPVIELPATAEPAAIGQALRTILAAKPHESMDLPDWDKTLRLVPDGLGVKHWNEVMDGSIHVEIMRLRTDLQFIPSVNEPDPEGDEEYKRTFRLLRDRMLHTTTNVDDGELGRVALEALAQSSIAR